ncbi:MAG: DUF4136 domain-containing protein [Gammaproteobacteria bacterium]
MNHSLVQRGRRAGTLALAALLFVGCASGPSIYVNTDPVANFSTYKTYNFIAPLGTDGPGYSSVLSQFLRIAASRELEARGYRKSEQPDLLINFNVETRDKLQATTMSAGPRFGGYYGYRSGYYGVWGGYETQVTQYTEGTLTVDVVDAARKQLAWDGTAVGRVREKDRRDLQPVIDEVVAQIFAKYPYRATPAP